MPISGQVSEYIDPKPGREYMHVQHRVHKWQDEEKQINQLNQNEFNKMSNTNPTKKVGAIVGLILCVASLPNYVMSRIWSVPTYTMFLKINVSHTIKE
jgi:hypothetical protein